MSVSVKEEMECKLLDVINDLREVGFNVGEPTVDQLNNSCFIRSLIYGRRGGIRGVIDVHIQTIKGITSSITVGNLTRNGQLTEDYLWMKELTDENFNQIKIWVDDNMSKLKSNK